MGYHREDVDEPSNFTTGLASSIYQALGTIATTWAGKAGHLVVDHVPDDALDDIVIPEIPDISDLTRSLEATLAAINDLIATWKIKRPEFVFSYQDDQYVSGLLDALKSRILVEVQSGDYGLDPAMEALLFSRARDREVQAAQAGIDGATRLHAAGGFAAPTGAAVAAVQMRERELLEKTVSGSREIMIKQADLQLAGKKVAYEVGASIEKVASDLHTATMGRQLDAAKARLQADVDAFMAEVKGFEAVAGMYEKAFTAQATVVSAYSKTIESYYTAIMTKVKTQLDKILGVAGLRIERDKVQANIWVGLAAAAMGTINVNASLSESNSFSQSKSASSSSSESISDSDSKSTSDTTSYEPDAGGIRTTHWHTYPHDAQA